MNLHMRISRLDSSMPQNLWTLGHLSRPRRSRYLGSTQEIVQKCSVFGYLEPSRDRKDHVGASWSSWLGSIGAIRGLSGAGGASLAVLRPQGLEKKENHHESSHAHIWTFSNLLPGIWNIGLLPDRPNPHSQAPESKSATLSQAIIKGSVYRYLTCCPEEAHCSPNSKPE